MATTKQVRQVHGRLLGEGLKYGEALDRAELLVLVRLGQCEHQ